MEKLILSDLCNDINKLDVIENKDIFITRHKDIVEKISVVDNYLNNQNNDNDLKKTFIDIVNELTDLNILELNNNMTIEKIKYYNDLLIKYQELLINEKNNIENVDYV